MEINKRYDLIKKICKSHVKHKTSMNKCRHVGYSPYCRLARTRYALKNLIENGASREAINKCKASLISALSDYENFVITGQPEHKE
jgi:hypothetical protein